MRKPVLLMLSCLAALAAACGGSAHDNGTRQAMAGSAGVDLTGSALAGSGGALGDGDAAALVDAWNEHSQHLDISCYGYFEGSMRFRADRAQLTARQIALLGQLTSDSNETDCASDGLSCAVTITDDAGAAVQYNAYASGNCTKNANAISYDSFSPLLDTLGCKFAQRVSPALSASSGCLNGLATNALADQPLALADGGRAYHVELDQCPAGKLTLQLFGDDPSMPIASGAAVADPGPDQACLALDVTVSEPLTAKMVVTYQSEPANTGGGEFFFQFR